MRISVGGDSFEYNVKGKPLCLPHQRLIDEGIDLSKESSWHKHGYTVRELFDKFTYQDFQNAITNILLTKFKECGINLAVDKISQYHDQIKSYEQHLAVIERTKLVDAIELAPYFEKLEGLVSTICGVPVHSIKPMNGERAFHFRIIRPNQKDFNPLHKDCWMDELKDCINLYIPICGSNEKSSLILAEESHLLTEDTFIRTSEGAQMNGVHFNVPGLISSKQPLHFVRPNPSSNQILVFSPYLIHGGSMNLNLNQTRISLEMRFWKKN